jgi:hypothetical protein
MSQTDFFNSEQEQVASSGGHKSELSGFIRFGEQSVSQLVRWLVSWLMVGWLVG